MAACSLVRVGSDVLDKHVRELAPCAVDRAAWSAIELKRASDCLRTEASASHRGDKTTAWDELRAPATPSPAGPLHQAKPAATGGAAVSRMNRVDREKQR
jgi:hypothetical protein